MNGNVPAAFWIATIILTLLAMTILSIPLLVRRQRNVLLFVLLGMPVLGVGLYFVTGSPGIASASATHPTNTATTTTAGTTPRAGPIADLVDGLAARLEENPGDGKGWLLLAQSYEQLNRIEEAKDAYAKAVALGATHPSLDALIGKDTSHVEMNPDAAVTGTVRLSPAAQEIVLPTDTVFIFARAPGQAGAPAAVIQTTAASLPIEFRLSDSQSMVAGASLSDLEAVVVTARITRNGGPGEAVQGLEAKSGVVAVTGGEPVELVIQ